MIIIVWIINIHTIELYTNTVFSTCIFIYLAFLLLFHTFLSIHYFRNFYSYEVKLVEEKVDDNKSNSSNEQNLIDENKALKFMIRKVQDDNEKLVKENNYLTNVVNEPWYTFQKQYFTNYK